MVCINVHVLNVSSFPSWARAGHKKSLSLLHNPPIIKFIHSLLTMHKVVVVSRGGQIPNNKWVWVCVGGGGGERERKLERGCICVGGGSVCVCGVGGGGHCFEFSSRTDRMNLSCN